MKKITSKSSTKKIELNDILLSNFQNYLQHCHFIWTLEVKLKTKWVITGSWEHLVY